MTKLIVLTLASAFAAVAQRIPVIVAQPKASTSIFKPHEDRKCAASAPITTGTAIGTCGAGFDGKLLVSGDLSSTVETAKVKAVYRQHCAILLVLGEYGSLCIPPTQTENAIWTPQIGMWASRPEGIK